MSEQLLDLLKLGLLALLYLFFLRVIWAVWTELRSPDVEVAQKQSKRRKPKAPKPSQRALTKLMVIEPAELAGGHYELLPEMTLGRAPGCNIVVDDTYVSQLHARVFSQNGQFHLEDLGSTNGTLHNGAGVSAVQPLTAGDRIQVGNMLLELS